MRSSGWVGVVATPNRCWPAPQPSPSLHGAARPAEQQRQARGRWQQAAGTAASGSTRAPLAAPGPAARSATCRHPTPPLGRASGALLWRSPVSGDTRFCSALMRMAGLILRAASAATLLLLLPMFQSLRGGGGGAGGGAGAGRLVGRRAGWRARPALDGHMPCAARQARKVAATAHLAPAAHNNNQSHPPTPDERAGKRGQARKRKQRGRTGTGTGATGWTSLSRRRR